MRQWVAGLSCLLVSISAAFAGEPPRLVATLPEAEVVVTLPGEVIDVGEKRPFQVKITPVAGQPAPTQVRARLGMPFMGHWVMDEKAAAFDGDKTFAFPGEFPMYGWYRLRVWLDYPDQRDVKTAVDFKVMTGEPLQATVAE